MNKYSPRRGNAIIGFQVDVICLVQIFPLDIEGRRVRAANEGSGAFSSAKLRRPRVAKY